jgi:hypothetical protein
MPHLNSTGQGMRAYTYRDCGVYTVATGDCEVSYLKSIPRAARGRAIFRTAGCTGCHNADQGKRVPSFIVPMKTIFPGDDPVVLAQRQPPLNPIMNTPNSIFDHKMAVVNASMRGGIRGIAMPLLLDLARKPVFLHDNSVSSLDELLDAWRGTSAPHPFYLSAAQRPDVIEFLKSLGTEDSEARR